MNCTDMVQDCDECWDTVNIVMNLCVPQHSGKFFTSQGTISF